MTLVRMTNAVLALLAAIWWYLNRHSGMAEPIFAIVAALLFIEEFSFEVGAKRLHARRDAQRAIEASVLPDLLERIDREESNIQQVIDGKRKESEVIEEYPIELLEPHVPKLKQLRRFHKLAEALGRELERNTKLPAGRKDFGMLQKVLSQIKHEATLPASNSVPVWLPWLISLSLVGVGVYGLLVIRLPYDVKSSDLDQLQQRAPEGEHNPKSSPDKVGPDASAQNDRQP